MRILVTGATGNLGSAIIETLLKQISALVPEPKKFQQPESEKNKYFSRR